MKLPPRLRLEPRPSRIAGASLVAACAATSILLALLPLPAMVDAAGAVLVVAVLRCGLWRCAGRGVPALLHVGLDRSIAVTSRDGRSRAGAILDDSYVGAWLTTIVWRPAGMPSWRPARTIVVLPDTLPEEDFRRLRVVLRYGRPVVDETSGDAAG
jgi:hypothetical protein